MLENEFAMIWVPNPTVIMLKYRVKVSFCGTDLRVSELTPFLHVFQPIKLYKNDDVRSI